ncbi:MULTISPECIES: MFS transporter [Legionella]|uniref:MFS transporter n=1 Tax=Legionella septentrionalis TaxID=2498109 RepID=A0A3S0VNH1_9GAMM|nr:MULTISPECIES: MFS transporter [Legionella]MCP0914900.1 MFS transporter [Legionella sp. 27cVA30]RUQ88849.1 MFS transporter [Legionella septentrionalis]RUR02961.1 MFS transporter [Legionella septentrionalis]RUR11560.1 MFS transporter [Legionella septentrionalis]RUR16826.1 MFS transporter [Legionella septentrionalis]
MRLNRNITACIIGNVLEWYEFSLFAYLSPIIAQLFFPTQNPGVGLLSTLLVFAAGFVIRPLGSIILGYLGDRFGRAKTLKLTIFLMSISSVLTGLIPTFQQIGILAPILLVICRLLQGFCIGGEFAGSMIYLSEAAQNKQRAYISSMTNNGCNIGVLIAVVACALLTHCLSESNILAYGWRALFISGGVLGLTGLWLRRDLPESETFQTLQKNITEPYHPVTYVIKHQRKRMLHVILLLVISACGSYTLMGYLSTYMYTYLNVSMHTAYHMQILFILLSLIFLPFFALLADRYGRKTVLIFATTGYLLFAVPCFWFLQSTPLWWVLLPLVIFYSAEQAVMPVVIVEMFPGKGRYTGISLAYNLCMATAGGFSPALNTWLINHFSDNLMIAYYVMACAFISFVMALKYLPKTYGAHHDLSLA